MIYKIKITDSATLDLMEHADLIAADSRIQAFRWLIGAWDAFVSLQEMPRRYAIISEFSDSREDVRDLVHHSHRIVYRVNDDAQQVEILRVWHMSRRELSERDLP